MSVDIGLLSNVHKLFNSRDGLQTYATITNKNILQQIFYKTLRNMTKKMLHYQNKE